MSVSAISFNVHSSFLSKAAVNFLSAQLAFYICQLCEVTAAICYVRLCINQRVEKHDVWITVFVF